MIIARPETLPLGLVFDFCIHDSIVSSFDIVGVANRNPRMITYLNPLIKYSSSGAHEVEDVEFLGSIKNHLTY